jgi:plasmid stability protein
MRAPSGRRAARPPRGAQRRAEAPTLPSIVQARLERYYGLEDAPRVDDFVRPVGAATREAVLVRELDDGLELAVRLPRAALERSGERSLDLVCQVVEGVSHFVYLAERARRELPATQLELELQAEIDKFVMLVIEGVYARSPAPVDAEARADELRARLFERVRFVHPEGSERGERYRMANSLAARFARRLEAAFAREGRFDQLRRELRRFYRAGQTEKLELARAA